MEFGSNPDLPRWTRRGENLGDFEGIGDKKEKIGYNFIQVSGTEFRSNGVQSGMGGRLNRFGAKSLNAARRESPRRFRQARKNFLVRHSILPRRQKSWRSVFPLFVMFGVVLERPFSSEVCLQIRIRRHIGRYGRPGQRTVTA